MNVKVLFICTGNTCRSPMAQTLLSYYAPQLEVKSAGISAMDGALMNRQAEYALDEIRVPHAHTAQQITTELVGGADIVLTMTLAHQDMLAREFPGFRHKKFPVIQHVEAEPREVDIQDPFGQSADVHRKPRDELAFYVKKGKSK